MKVKFAGKRQGLHLIFALIALLLGAVVCNAGDITYNVDRTVGTGTVTGFIETDGSTGVLGVGDIVNWNLELKAPGYTFDLTGPGNNIYVVGSDLTATSTQLLFNFSGSDNGYFLIQQGPESGQTYYCDQTSSIGPCLAGESDVPGKYLVGGFLNEPRSGNVVIGSTTPEPASMLLMGTFVLGAAGALRRKLML